VILTNDEIARLMREAARRVEAARLVRRITANVWRRTAK